MKRILFIISLSVFALTTKAQSHGLRISRDSIVNTLSSKLSRIDNVVKLRKKDSINIFTSIHIKDTRKYMSLSPGLRYLTDNLDDYYSDDIEFVEALDELIEYVRNDSLRSMSRYLIKYSLNTGKREAALKKVKDVYLTDSLRCKSYKYLPSRNIDKDSLARICSDLEDVNELLAFIDKDKSYEWIKKISRDSVNLSIKNASNDSLNLWVKNGRKESYRFWIKNTQNDSIGAWIQTTKNKALKIILDFDVYQESKKGEKSVLKYRPINLIDSSMLKVGKLYPYKRIPTKWRYASIVNMGLTQGKVANWQEGGENSIAGLLDVKAFCTYKFENITWENNLNYRYGLMQSGDEQTKKTEDLMEFNTKWGVRFYNNWYFSTMFNFRTQILKGYNYLENDIKEMVSGIMSPGYILFSLGLDYKPSDKLSVLISPFTGKYTIVMDTLNVDATKYGIKKGEKIKRELGSYFKAMHKWKIADDISLDNEMGIFYGYEGGIDETDIDWKTTLDMKVNYFISTKIFTHVLYDKTVSKRLQFKEIFNIGVTYHF
jgi:hypothetical protein